MVTVQTSLACCRSLHCIPVILDVTVQVSLACCRTLYYIPVILNEVKDLALFLAKILRLRKTLIGTALLAQNDIGCEL